MTSSKCFDLREDSNDDQQGSMVLSDVSDTSHESHEETLDSVTKDTSAKQVKAKVTFYPSVVVRVGLHLSDYTDEELVNCWYTHAQYSQIRRDFEPTLMLITAKEYAGDCEEHCARGLEGRCKKGLIRRQLHKNMACDAVLYQQHAAQFRTGMRDDELIAEAYAKATTHCRTTALKRGLIDAMTVTNVSDVEYFKSMVRKARQQKLSLRGATSEKRTKKSRKAQPERLQ